MKRFVMFYLLGITFCAPIFACGAGSTAVSSCPPAVSIPTQLRQQSVTVRTPQGQGSGVLRETRDGRVYVLTAGHVIAHLRTVRESDTKKQIVEFRDANIFQYITEDGRKVGDTSLDAEVIRYSDADHGEDLALLRIRSKAFRPETSVRFYGDKAIPEPGTELYHCGSLLGQDGSNSITTGVISANGRIFGGVVYDQTSCTAFPGSSGGGVYLKGDGRYVGMIVRGSGEGFNLTVPIRRILLWADRTGVRFVFDDKLPVPSDGEIRKKPVEEAP